MLVPRPADATHRLLALKINDTGLIDLSYNADSEPSFRKINLNDVRSTPVDELDESVLPYLYASRYCPSDQLVQFAERTFGNNENPFATALHISKWINENVAYVTGSTNSSTSALDILTQRVGVCRDFAHLGITLCRALNMPARYCSAYAYQLEPPDFHACFEVFIGGEWIVFDGTGLAPLNGLTKIAHGRDAADTAVASLFGKVSNREMSVKVSCDDQNFIPYFYNETGQTEGVSLDALPPVGTKVELKQV